MARKRRRRPIAVAKFRGEGAPGALADQTVYVWAILNAPTTGHYLISMDTLVGTKAMTAGEGPLLVGVAHGDYTETEIKECLEQKDAFTSDMVDKEQAGRKVREIGVLPGIQTEEVLNDGKMIRTKLKFFLQQGQALNAFVYNDSGAALSGGASISFYGKIYARRT